jgi:cytochrome c oxidase cbb3-type subunit 2
MKHEALEKNVGLLMAFILVCISLGGMIQIFPLIFEGKLSQPIETLKPLSAVQLEGRDIYMREGCAVCHTQMVRPLQHETARYGHYSVAGEDAYEHPFLWGSKRTGPDLARVGGRYSDAWHVAHLMNPRSVVPVSNMPAYPWLFENELDGADTAAKMKTLRTLGVPYTDADIESAQATVQGTTEAQALIAYLQNLGLDMRGYGGSQ